MYAAFLAQANGYLVALAPPVGLNLTASVSGGAAPWAGPPETRFEIFELGGGRVALRSEASGKFVCAEDAGRSPLVCNRDGAWEWETFDVVDLGNDDVALRATVNGKYVCAEDAGWRPLVANRDAIGSWETFRMVRVHPHDGLVHELDLTVRLGADDLRGGTDNLDLRLDLVDGSRRHAPNLNAGRRWEGGHGPRAYVQLDPPLARDSIQAITLTATVGGGLAGDNIDIERVLIEARVDGQLEQVALGGPARLTAAAPSLTIPVGVKSTLVLKIDTGDDDLRGGNDNLTVLVHPADGTDLTFPNVNAGMPWRSGSLHEVPLSLGAGIGPDDLTGITLTARLSGGWNGDNWDMAWLEGRLRRGSSEEQLFRHGFKRFTGADRVLHVTRE